HGVERFDAGPRDPALAWRALHMGKPGGMLPCLQSAQGRPVRARSWNETVARAALVQLAHLAPPDAHDGAFGREVAEVLVLLEVRAVETRIGRRFQEYPRLARFRYKP